jgi:hypothetical protein
MRFHVCAVLFLTVFAVPAAALADGPTTFGKAGQLAISWDQPMGGVAVSAAGGLSAPVSMSAIDFQYITASNNGGSGTHFGIAPAADYFVIDSLSIGGQVLFGLSSLSPGNGGPSSSVTSFGIAPQVGYNLGLTDNISFWPKLYFAYVSSSTNNNGPSVSTGTLGIFAPFLYHPAQHFYLGIGPNLASQLVVSQSNNGNSTQNPSKLTVFGVMATFGGWFLGD